MERRWRTSKIVQVVDLYGFTLELDWKDAAVLKDIRRRVTEKHRLWWSMEASKGSGWYLHPEAFSSSLTFGKFTTGVQMRKLVREGIPPALRSKVWLSMSGAAKKRSTVPSTYYMDIIQAVEGRVTAATKQIDHDVPRTFPSHPLIDSVEGHQRLRRILVAYSFRDSRVGYCQGMNYITAFLLLVMKSEEDAFWMLAVLLEDLLHNDTYSDDLCGCHVEQSVFKNLLKHKTPRLASHFGAIAFDTSLVTTEWFLCLFSKTLPSETTMRIWDVLFNEGANIMLVVALAIFQTKEEELLCANQAGEAVKILQNAAQGGFDPDLFLKPALEKLGLMTIYSIEKHRKKQQPVVMAELQQRVRQR